MSDNEKDTNNVPEVTEELSLTEMMQRMTGAIDEWKAMQKTLKEKTDEINALRSGLSSHGIHIALEEFDNAQQTTTVVPSMAPPVPGGIVNQDQNVQDVNIPQGVQDTRTPEQIHAEAMAPVSSQELYQEAERFQMDILNGYEKALQAGWSQADNLARNAPGSHTTLNIGG